MCSDPYRRENYRDIIRIFYEVQIWTPQLIFAGYYITQNFKYFVKSEFKDYDALRNGKVGKVLTLTRIKHEL